MDAFVITGGQPLRGQVRINGSKNAALPLMAAALLTDEPLILRDVPDLADIRNMTRLLGELGCESVELDADTLATAAASHPDQRIIEYCTRTEAESHARYDVVRTMRASICVLGPLLAKRGVARVSMPGGCAIGQRPVDLHLKGLEALGAKISLVGGDILATVPRGGLVGAPVFMGGAFGSTVLGTANIMCAAALAKGTTIIESAACEPEIVDLAALLTKMGAQIKGAGSPRIIVQGVERLGEADHTIIPDRIEAGTYICAAAATEGDVTITNCPLDALMALTTTLTSMGVTIEPVDMADAINPLRANVRVTPPRRLKPVEITTQPHPGFPTDLQAQLMALLCRADGISLITEKIFPDRFLHVPELSRMGAQIYRRGPIAIIHGVHQLSGAPVMASDLRASASLIIAALAASGTTTINRVYHLDRGYEHMETRLSHLGADIERVEEQELAAV
jgi:UDP-N-acetylglucosamine 1-carboxyvinyltransferase